MTEIKNYFDIQLTSGIHACAKLIATNSETLAFVFAIYESKTGRYLANKKLHVDACNGYLGLFFKENSIIPIRFDDIEISLFRRDDNACIAIKSPMIAAEVELKGLSVGYF